jgi:hypothetical protein
LNSPSIHQQIEETKNLLLSLFLHLSKTSVLAFVLINFWLNTYLNPLPKKAIPNKIDFFKEIGSPDGFFEGV